MASQYFIVLYDLHFNDKKVSRSEAYKLPAHLKVQLFLFIALAYNRFINPGHDLKTLLSIVFTLLFCLGAIYYCKKSEAKNLKAVALLFFCSAILLINPSILTLNNYIFEDEAPFVSNLRTTELDHPIFRVALLPDLYQPDHFAIRANNRRSSILSGRRYWHK